VHVDETREHVDDAAGPDAAGDVNGQALAGPLFDDGQTLERLPVGARVLLHGYACSSLEALAFDL